MKFRTLRTNYKAVYFSIGVLCCIKVFKFKAVAYNLVNCFEINLINLIVEPSLTKVVLSYITGFMQNQAVLNDIKK